MRGPRNAVEDACREHGIALARTGPRLFHHREHRGRRRARADRDTATTITPLAGVTFGLFSAQPTEYEPVTNSHEGHPKPPSGGHKPPFHGDGHKPPPGGHKPPLGWHNPPPGWHKPWPYGDGHGS
ncbi:hypothetical protein [Streptomyces malaysiensis]|uniref:hypothetical protein n=1 Tax=Streptomyces malaysiensis TaxID=92644 RepID=UPI0024C07E01|nr:hypothetical protein [Streptomyces sp. NA07423]WHX23703.1 hypothetical protein QFW82_44990 [Streptomyces sp. NA07423]